jgi:hypothetical protein
MSRDSAADVRPSGDMKSECREQPRLPSKGDRVEVRRQGVQLRGTVSYSDHRLQVLVKWDDGSSSSLRVDKGDLQALRVIETDQDANAA